MLNKALPIIKCSGTPREMGIQYGEQAKDDIKINLEQFSIKHDSVMLNEMKNNLKLHMPEILEELEGIAIGAQVDLDLLLSYNHWELNLDNHERCTVFVLHSEDKGLLIAKNNDSPVGENGKFVIRRGYPTNGIPFVQITYAGFLSGLDMMNLKGLCNTHGSVGSAFERKGSRLDIRLVIYNLMQKCTSVDEILQKLNTYNLTGKGFSIAFGDANSNSCIVDAAVPFLGKRDINKKFAYSTNLYEFNGFENADMRLPHRRNICLYRNGYMKWIEQTNPPKNLDDLIKLSSSHEPWAPCRHGRVHGSITDWSVIFMPAKRRFLISHGPSCQNQYQDIEL
jgi:predicted choloylglycine hydrolase